MQIVGKGLIDTLDVHHAFLWENGVMTDLNALVDGSADGWELLEAAAINDLGQIVGSGHVDRDLDGSWDVTRAYLLTPIPEPATLGLAALAGITLLRRRCPG